ncbi:uncharacterized protein [Centruroides vittatus]|uniref:uncharacterized protein n=1 Tax=Centruroides vittatus TaxID=120091 RepID=UPI00350F86E8
MMHLVCHCLNVCIHTKNNVIQSTPINSLALTNEETLHTFFQGGVATVTLDLGGITMAQSILVTSCHVGEWIVYTCGGCGLNTHAIHRKQKTEHILINTDMTDKEDLKTKLTDLKTKQNIENYSLVFKIILPEINDNQLDSKSDVKFQMKSSKTESALASIQKQVATYLQQEHKAMEERIRIFTQQQQNNFAALQKKVRRDKCAMLSLLQKQQEKDLKESIGEAMSENNYSSLNSNDDNSVSQELFETSCNGQFKPFQLPQTKIEVNTRNPSYNRSQSFDTKLHSAGKKNAAKSQMLSRRRIFSLDTDAGGIFDMEGLEQEFSNTPFYNSDYEDDTDDSSTTEENTLNFRKKLPKQFAQSLPIKVPVWSQFNHSSGSEEEEKFVVTGDPEQIAESIKALTITDGTEMFGDLPRRRLNTGDLVKSRPL